MEGFLNDDFMLKNETAKRLFHDHAEKLPLIDYHCHISPKEIYENRRYKNIAEVWLGGKNADGTYFGDHYKWRVMRSNGVPEEYITGDKDPYEKFLKFAESLEMAIGNPMYHWCSLELKKYFGIDEPLTAENAEAIWKKTTELLQTSDQLTVRGIIEQSNVQYIGTTDDPVDTLEWHERIAADESISFMVCPSYRPDKAINIQKDGFADYIRALAASVGKEKLETIKEVQDALMRGLIFSKSMVAGRPTTVSIMCPLHLRKRRSLIRSCKRDCAARSLLRQRSTNTRRLSCFPWQENIKKRISSWRFTIPARGMSTKECLASKDRIPALT